VVTDVTWAFIAHMISMDKNIQARVKDFLFSKPFERALDHPASSSMAAGLLSVE
jgi:hypothetical protein